MDQLSSHKLRHEGKSLICEICAYACKRKYELRTHMLAKHSGTDKQGAVYNCKYCAYTTCYRQALQNHENCKHTKLKEYQCALCSYSSFSTVSLFLHKRKAHGYVPGDKAWLANYASVEKERNSAKLVDFFDKSSMKHQPVEQPSREEPLKKQSADPSANTKSVRDSPIVHINNACSAASQEIASESVPGSPMTIANDSEEYCTLVLTTLSTTDYQTPTSENQDSDMCKTPNSSTLHCQVLHQSPLFSPFSAEEGNSAIVDAELEQCDLDESLTYMVQTPTSTGKDDFGIAGPSSSPEKKQLLQSNEALKKHDKEQAETMVLEGRVQMLVVGRKESRYFCNECSYATNKEADFVSHCQAANHRPVPQHGHQASGAQSTPKQGLEGLREKMCPGLQRKTATSELNSTVSEEETENEMTEELEAGEGLSAPNRLGTADSMSQQMICKDPILDTLSFGELQLQYALQDDGKYACMLCHFTSVREATMERHLSKCEKRLKGNGSVLRNKSREGFIRSEQKVNREDNLLLCPNCQFRCYRKRDLENHQKKGCAGVDEPNLQCPHCPFKCKREQSMMARHMVLKHMGKRPCRPVCDSCGKTFASYTKLRQHNLRVHHKQPSHFCSQCDFAGYSTDDIKRHQRRCHTTVGAEGLCHSCTFCTAKFSSAVALRHHCRRAHVPLMEKETRQAKGSADATKSCAIKYQCYLCSVATKTRRLLVRHLLSVHEEGSREDKPLRCNTCEFACRHQMVLEQHLRLHGGRRLYKCADCNYSTRNRQKMTWHLRIHTGEKPYGCEQCQYTCTDPLRLKVQSQENRTEYFFLIFNKCCKLTFSSLASFLSINICSLNSIGIFLFFHI